MPSLFRLIFFCAILAALGWGAMVALAVLVEPTQRELTVRIPANKLNPQ